MNDHLESMITGDPAYEEVWSVDYRTSGDKPASKTWARDLLRDFAERMLSDRTRTNPYTYIPVKGSCPVCGEAQLGLTRPDSGPGVLHCMNIRCQDTSAPAAILADRETEHRVTFGTDGFTIRHPLRERLGDALMSCDLHTHLITHRPEEADRPGLYRATFFHGHWVFVSLKGITS